MGNPRRTRKRVRAIRRAPDGSAFQKCNSCGASVPIALAGMLECELNENVKRFRGVSVDVKKQSIWDQLVIMAPFHFFLKEFTKTSKAGNWVAINREGFEAWKNDKAYQKALIEEANDKFKVDDEADSTAIRNNGKPGEFSEDYENSDGSYVFWDHSATTGSWHTHHWPGQWCMVFEDSEAKKSPFLADRFFGVMEASNRSYKKSDSFRLKRVSERRGKRASSTRHF